MMAEMEDLAAREGRADRALGDRPHAGDPRPRARTVVLEVGTAIGYSTLHMAEPLERGRVVTLERDPERAARAREFLERAGVADRRSSSRATRRRRSRPSRALDLLFVDASKGEYARYIELADPLLSERALLVVDNLLMSGEVALPEKSTSGSGARLAAARALNLELTTRSRSLGSVMPVGDGWVRRPRISCPAAISRCAEHPRGSNEPRATRGTSSSLWELQCSFRPPTATPRARSG